MRSGRGVSFEDFYSELEDEARDEGPRAILDLRAKELKYALVNTLITKRQQLNLTQQMLAQQSGVAQTEISKIERGRKSPTLDTFSRLASALRIALRPIAIKGLGLSSVGQVQGRVVFSATRATAMTARSRSLASRPTAKRATSGTARRVIAKKARRTAAGRGASRKTAVRKAANTSKSRTESVRPS